MGYLRGIWHTARLPSMPLANLPHADTLMMGSYIRFLSYFKIQDA